MPQLAMGPAGPRGRRHADQAAAHQAPAADGSKTPELDQHQREAEEHHMQEEEEEVLAKTPELGQEQQTVEH